MRTPLIYGEAELVKGLKERDEKSYICLYNQYAGALYSIILQIVPDQDIANDILHDAFISIWKKIDTYDENRCRIFTWMLSITRDLAIDTIRSKTYQTSHKNQDTPEVIHMNVDGTLSQLQVDAFGFKKLLHHLSGDDRALINLSWFQGYTREEIVEIEELSHTGVTSKLRAAFIQLREHLK